MKSIVFCILSILVVSAAVYQRNTFGVADTAVVFDSIPAMFYLISETHNYIFKRYI